MKICFLCVEIFAWGKYGGFGRATRLIGRELVKRGYDVYAIVPRRGEQKTYEELDGIKVYGFEQTNMGQIIKFARAIDADVYHSEEPSLITYFAKRAMPTKKHVVTFRDPRDLYDWWLEFVDPSVSKIQVLANYLFEHNPLVKRVVKKLDGHYSAAQFLVDKSQRIYRLDQKPAFLPTPAPVVEDVEKSATPMVCFLARWGRRKRPELFFELAKKFPHVDFVAVGSSRDKKYEAMLREKYASVENLKMPGFLNQFDKGALTELLGKSWVMVNTASREGLPNSFIEAAAHKCAILSAVNPDDFASNFGFHVVDDNFYDGLKFLLEDNRWRSAGERGYQFVKQTFDSDIAISKHMSIYNDLMGTVK